MTILLQKQTEIHFYKNKSYCFCKKKTVVLARIFLIHSRFMKQWNVFCYI